MNKRIAVVAATAEELSPFLAFLQKDAAQHSFQSYQLHQLQIDILYTGIGVMQTTFSLMDYISHRHPDAWIQAGIGGAYDRALSIQDVYHVTSEVLIGMGAQQRDGSIRDAFRMGWMDPDAFPYEGGILHCPYRPKWNLSNATGMTSFFSHGQAEAIAQLEKSITGQIENMEGVPFFYISLLRKIPFLSIRCISNYVAPRNFEDWKIPEAIHSLCAVLINWMTEHDFNVDRMFGIGAKNE